jgi:hypothetical protein
MTQNDELYLKMIEASLTWLSRIDNAFDFMIKFMTIRTSFLSWWYFIYQHNWSVDSTLLISWILIDCFEVICLFRFKFLTDRFKMWWSLQIWLLIDLFDWSFKNELSIHIFFDLRRRFWTTSWTIIKRHWFMHFHNLNFTFK